MLGYITQYFKPPESISTSEVDSSLVKKVVEPEAPQDNSQEGKCLASDQELTWVKSAWQLPKQILGRWSERLQGDLRFTWWNLSAVTLVIGVLIPSMTYPLYAACRLVFGTLYPAYASYKAVRTKNVREYVKWMMYWIVFAFFTTFESMADLFIAFWFPFYYELKIIFLLWLISPVSRGSLGSSMLYRKLIHPNLMKREDEIDRMIGKLQEQGYNTAIRFGSQAFQYVTNLVMTTAIRGGGGIVSQLKKSYSLTDLSNMNEADYDQNGKSRDPANRSYPRAIGYHGQPEDDPYFSRERSESRGSGSRSRDNPYEPMFYSESPMRHHTRRQISDTYGSPSTELYPETTRRKSGAPHVKESLLVKPTSNKRPKTLAMSSSMSQSRLASRLAYPEDTEDLPRAKSMAVLPSKSKTPSPTKSHRPQVLGSSSTLPRKKKSRGASGSNPNLTRRTTSNRNIAHSAKRDSVTLDELNEVYLPSFSSTESDDDDELYLYS